MRLVFRALLDPAFEDQSFFLGEWTVDFVRRHDVIGIVCAHANDHFARLDIARDNRAFAAVEHHRGTFESIQSQSCFATFIAVGSMAAEAAIREHWANVTVEVDFFRQVADQGGRCRFIGGGGFLP